MQLRNEIDRLASHGVKHLDDLYEMLSESEYHRAFIIADWSEGMGAPPADVLAEINRRFEAVCDDITEDTLVDISETIVCDIIRSRRANLEAAQR